MSTTLGFSGDPHAFLTTADLAARMGYGSVKSFYNDAARRRAQGFPLPVRPGIWRLGDLQDWSNGAQRRKAERPPALVRGTDCPDRQEDRSNQPRDAVRSRLHLAVNNR